MDSISVVLVSACLLLTPADKSCTSLLFARADLTLSEWKSIHCGGAHHIGVFLFINLIWVVYILGK